MSLSHALSQHSVTRTRNSYPAPAPHPHAWLCGFPHPPCKCGYPQPARVNLPAQDSNGKFLEMPNRASQSMEDPAMATQPDVNIGQCGDYSPGRVEMILYWRFKQLDCFNNNRRQKCSLLRKKFVCRFEIRPAQDFNIDDVPFAAILLQHKEELVMTVISRMSKKIIPGHGRYWGPEGWM